MGRWPLCSCLVGREWRDHSSSLNWSQAVMTPRKTLRTVVHLPGEGRHYKTQNISAIRLMRETIYCVG